MNESQSDADATPDAAPAAPVEVEVKRTGGVAGLTKRWLAAPAEPEASVWIDLIAQCPWDATAPTPEGESADRAASAGADRFVWWIHARCGEQDEREAELPDDQMVGAWRALVDAVREWNRSAAG
jgi:hypothetical protein